MTKKNNYRIWVLCVTCCRKEIRVFRFQKMYLSLSRKLKDMIERFKKFQCYRSWGRLNIKMSSYQDRGYHQTNKTASRPSYLYSGNPIPGKTVFILRRGPDALWQHTLHFRILERTHCVEDLSVSFRDQRWEKCALSGGPHVTVHLPCLQL